MTKSILVTGAGGYVGSILLPQLIRRGYRVKALDLFIYGTQVLEEIRGNANLEIIQGDIRNQNLLRQVLPGCDKVIHLACISNDPSFELNPTLGKSINLDAFRPLVEIAYQCGVRRFIYASSSSVYGIKQVSNVTEDMSLEPLTDYSKFKAICEAILAEYQCSDFTTVTLRPATICGYSPRQRLDVVVNILTNLAYHTGVVKVLGGDQLRPNLHIKDMADAYQLMLEAPDPQVAGKIYNVGYENQTVRQLAESVQRIVSKDKVRMVIVPTDDNRSYHISSVKIAHELGFSPRHTIEEAIHDLLQAFKAGLLHDPMNNSLYYNIKRMQEIHLT